MNTGTHRTSAASVSPGTIRKYALWLAAMSLLASSLAQAQPSLDVKLWEGTTSLGDWTPAVVGAGSAYTIYDTTYTLHDASLHLYNTSLSPDPFISASVDVVNTTASVQTYTLIFTLPISPAILGSSLIGGSTQGGITDANGDGIGTLSTAGPGTALYFGRIDNVNVLPLFGDPTAMTVPFAGGSTSQSTSAGLPGPTLAGPAVLSSIGIEHQFTLTPGDRATFTSFFEAVPTPEPATLSLLAIGGLMLVCRRRG